MPKGYLIHLETGDAMEFVDFIAIGSGSPPPRPHPGPDPGEPPRPWDPQFPSNPIQLPPWVGKPQPPFPGQPPGGNGDQQKVVGVVGNLPADITPPAAPTANVKAMKVWFGPGTLPTIAWVEPNASTGPVEPPAGTTPPPA